MVMIALPVSDAFLCDKLPTPGVLVGDLCVRHRQLLVLLLLAPRLDQVLQFPVPRVRLQDRVRDAGT